MSAPDSGPLAQVTAAEVLRWGRAQPADSVVGKCVRPGVCLIAKYAYTVLRKRVRVFPDLYTIGSGHYYHGRAYHNLPPSLDHLALAFDRLGSRGEAMHPADLDRLTMEATP